ncbi:DUF4199 family protein [Flavobacterium sp. NST-5]|uniref:DUF4199 family protein n=1 Tax=Flavobacterium ichthyis TaxID=2698827 RepID=A0ABW9Z5I8_9FLAO|nr:DUF4199 domain-containing protein [Flavobacterium ichthyis]NBL64113.1 DUF4199 family protein [Flavobacterium ichthyis]
MKKFAIEIKWAIRYTFCYIAYTFAEKGMGLYDQNINIYWKYSALFYVLAIFLFVVAIKDKKIHYFKNQMDWKQGTTSGLYLSLFIAILMPIAQVIIHKAIAPEFLENMVKMIVQKNNITLESAQKVYNLESQIYQSIFFTLSFGITISAIISSFLKTKTTKA